MNSKKIVFSILCFIATAFCFASEYDHVSYRSIIKHDKSQIQRHDTVLSSPLNFHFMGPEGGRTNAVRVSARGDTVLLATDGGLYISYNYGEKWSLLPIDAQRTESSVVMDVVYNNSLIYAATASGVYRSSNLGQTWQLIISAGQARFNSVIVADGNLYLGAYPANSNPAGFIAMQKDGTIEERNAGLGSPGIIHLKQSAANPERILACTTNGPYLTRDAGQSGWENISGNLPAGAILSCSEHKTDSTTFFAGTFFGLYTSTDNGHFWQDITPPTFASKEIRAIAHEPNLLLVGTGKGLYSSHDKGETWNDISTGIANKKIWSITIKPDKSIHITTMDGYYKSSDMGRNWQKLTSGIYATLCNSLVSDSTSYYVATAYSGILRCADTSI